MMMTRRRRALIATAAFAFGLAAVPTISTAQDDEPGGRVMFVFDASNSMWGQIDGRPKIEIARDAMGDALAVVPAGSEIGLTIYGHRERGSCRDIEVAVPMSRGRAAGDAIAGLIGRVKPRGKTPLSRAVRQAAEAMKYQEVPSTVVLVTDGIESCDADPCALADELERLGVDFTAHVVGFGLTREQGEAVACLAENTGGRFIPAGDEEELREALNDVVEPLPAPGPTPEPEPQKADLTDRLYLLVGMPAGTAFGSGERAEQTGFQTFGKLGTWNNPRSDAPNARIIQPDGTPATDQQFANGLPGDMNAWNKTQIRVAGQVEPASIPALSQRNISFAPEQTGTHTIELTFPSFTHTITFEVSQGMEPALGVPSGLVRFGIRQHTDGQYEASQATAYFCPPQVAEPTQADCDYRSGGGTNETFIVAPGTYRVFTSRWYRPGWKANRIVTIDRIDGFQDERFDEGATASAAEIDAASSADRAD